MTKPICGNCERALKECFAEPCTETYPIIDGRDMNVAFVVHVDSDGKRTLCEGGVYSSQPSGEYVEPDRETVFQWPQEFRDHHAQDLSAWVRNNMKGKGA